MMLRRTYKHNKKAPKRIQKKNLQIPFLSLAVFGGILLHSATGLVSSSNIERTTKGLHPQSLLNQLNTNIPKPITAPQWPKNIQSAVGALGYGVLAQSDPESKAVPMASLAKVMASILIIEKDDLSLDNAGSDITFNANDEIAYNKYLFDGGVVTAIHSGGTISQREALNAMLMASSNNIADTAVIHTFGSVDSYLEAANKKAMELGMYNTHYADVTGFSPKTVATASDLVLLAEYAMKDPLFAEIVATWETTILGTTRIHSTNNFLDFEGNGVIGIKSGLTDEAGGTFMTAARYNTPDGDIVALAVTLGAQNHFLAQKNAMPLLRNVWQAFLNN